MVRSRPEETTGQKAQQGAWLRLLCLFLFVLLINGCTSMINGKPPGPWHEAYEPLEHPESMTFISNALEQAVSEFGEPVVPVHQIILRRTQKKEHARNYLVQEDFTKTACIDSTNGIFVIYMGEDPDHENYYALLGHECAHLINPFLTDWYAEGMATVFSKEVCDMLGKEWGTWERHFKKSRHDPYALSYRMMTEMKERFPDQYSALMHLTTNNPRHPHWQWVDIDAWLATLPDQRRYEAVEIIQPYIKGLSRRTNEQYGFLVPSELIKE